MQIDTPWGRPSDAIRIGTVGGTRVAFLSRHGEGHLLGPADVPYAANICALKQLGVRRILSISAVGSLKEAIPPRSFVVPDQLFDRTLSRRRTFFDDGIVAHVGLTDPFCRDFAASVATAAQAGGMPVRAGGAYVCIEGPQFSTRFESELFRSWGLSVIGMTAMPEARLAREAELCYACLAMVTDYDVWHATNEPVTVEMVIANLAAMTTAVEAIVESLVDQPTPACTSGCESALATAIITDPARISADARRRLEPIAGKYLRTTGH